MDKAKRWINPDEAGTLKIPSSANLAASALERVRGRAAGPCKTCEAEDWLLTKWQRGTGYSVDIQCLSCGRSGGQPFQRNEHPNWESYPEFDRTVQDRWDTTQSEKYKKQREERSAGYETWLRISPEWAELRSRVIARANGRCEACMELGMAN